jgi:hypothetical protein
MRQQIFDEAMPHHSVANNYYFLFRHRCLTCSRNCAEPSCEAQCKRRTNSENTAQEASDACTRRHTRAGGYPEKSTTWIPACAGMTNHFGAYRVENSTFLASTFPHQHVAAHHDAAMFWCELCTCWALFLFEPFF